MLTIKEVTLSLDTDTYASGDVLADTQLVTGIFPNPEKPGVIRSVVILDKDDQGNALDLLFLEDASSIGTENQAVSVADAAADSIFGVIEVASGDYVDLVNSQIVAKHDLYIPIKPAAADTNSIGVAAIARGTPTHTASGVTLKLGIETHE